MYSLIHTPTVHVQCHILCTVHVPEYLANTSRYSTFGMVQGHANIIPQIKAYSTRDPSTMYSETVLCTSACDHSHT